MKVVRRKANPVVLNYINTPKKILHLHKAVSVAADKKKLYRMTVLVRISRHMKFTTVQYLGKSMMGNISKSSDNIIDVYYRIGMYVETFYMNREFENIRRKFTGRSTLNTTYEAENVPEIERHTRVIKERAGAIWSTLPFKKIPGQIFI